MFLPSDLCVHEVPFSVELVSVKRECVNVEITHSESVCVFDLLVSTDGECLEQLCIYLLTLMLFQTHIASFPLWKTKRDIYLNVHAALFNAIKLYIDQ